MKESLPYQLLITIGIKSTNPMPLSHSLTPMPKALHTYFSVILLSLPAVIDGNKCPLTGAPTPSGYQHMNGRYYKVNAGVSQAGHCIMTS